MNEKTSNWSEEERAEIAEQKRKDNENAYVKCTRCKTHILFDNRTGKGECKCKEGPAI